MLCVSMERNSAVNTQKCAPIARRLLRGLTEKRRSQDHGGGPQKMGLRAALCNIIAGELTMFIICILFLIAFSKSLKS